MRRFRGRSFFEFTCPSQLFLLSYWRSQGYLHTWRPAGRKYVMLRQLLRGLLAVTLVRTLSCEGWLSCSPLHGILDRKLKLLLVGAIRPKVVLGMLSVRTMLLPPTEPATGPLSGMAGGLGVQSYNKAGMYCIPVWRILRQSSPCGRLRAQVVEAMVRWRDGSSGTNAADGCNRSAMNLPGV